MKTGGIFLGFIAGIAAGVTISNYKSPSKKRNEIIDFFSRIAPELPTAAFTQMSDKEIMYYHQYLFDYFLKQLTVPDNSKLFFELRAIFEKYGLEDL